MGTTFKSMTVLLNINPNVNINLTDVDNTELNMFASVEGLHFSKLNGYSVLVKTRVAFPSSNQMTNAQ